MCLSWGISFHWPRNRDIQDEMVYATTLQIRVSQPLAKLSVPLKLNPVGLGWKQYIGDQPGIRAVLISLLFFLSCFLVFPFLLSYLIEKGVLESIFRNISVAGWTETAEKRQVNCGFVSV